MATSTSEDKSFVKQISRRRVSVFFLALLLVAISETAYSESDMLLHAVDDYVDIITAVVALALIVVWWRRQSIADLKKVNNVIAAAAVVILLATIFAITQEAGDPEDFGNEIPTLFFSIFLLINRFV